MGRPLGSKNLAQRGFDKHLKVPVHPDSHARYVSAAHRSGFTLAEFTRRALDEAVRSIDRYFYVRLTNGSTHPPITEVGYEFLENAQRFAHRCHGTVFRAAIEAPSHTPSDPAGDSAPAPDRLVEGQ